MMMDISTLPGAAATLEDILYRHIRYWKMHWALLRRPLSSASNRTATLRPGGQLQGLFVWLGERRIRGSSVEQQLLSAPPQT